MSHLSTMNRRIDKDRPYVDNTKKNKVLADPWLVLSTLVFFQMSAQQYKYLVHSSFILHSQRCDDNVAAVCILLLAGGS